MEKPNFKAEYKAIARRAFDFGVTPSEFKKAVIHDAGQLARWAPEDEPAEWEDFCLIAAVTLLDAIEERDRWAHREAAILPEAYHYAAKLG